MSFSNNDVQICDSAVDKLRLAMSPSGKIQQTNLTNLNNKKNCSMLGGNVDNFERGYNASMLGGSNLSLPTLLATLNATSKNNVQDSGESATTKKGSIKTGLLLESDDSPRSVFGLHPELLPKIDNINILFGTTNQDSTLKKQYTAQPFVLLILLHSHLKVYSHQCYQFAKISCELRLQNDTKNTKFQL
eukprot:TRINITY_DN49958_c0_g1_i6.p1 TRINITY_DN49958_c0_g1~~TRINITY_DN49958_c0_g1_i6.p1  ORF type:complete len:189 (-),score=23.60 TRINITY_DN49958_c0_g1_i6:217-783(-)